MSHQIFAHCHKPFTNAIKQVVEMIAVLQVVIIEIFFFGLYHADDFLHRCMKILVQTQGRGEPILATNKGIYNIYM